MKLIQDFNDFLADEVNLNPTRLQMLDKRVIAVTNFLANTPTFKEYYINIIPQGSFAHKTIIKPVQDDDEFDADVLLYLKEIQGWGADKYTVELYRSFENSATYKGKTKLGRRCVTIDYANDFHIDVVPYMERHGDHYITHRTTNQFLKTNPESYNAWLNEQNTITNRNLVKVIRLVKYLRDYRDNFDVKSIVLNVLLGGRVSQVDPLVAPGCYHDVPTTLRTVMNRLSEYVENNETLPTIEDPSGTGENFSNRWSQKKYTKFRTEIMRLARLIEEAWVEIDAPKSRAKWRQVFGDDFGAGKKTFAKSFSESADTPFGFVDTEQNLEDIGIPSAINPEYRFRIIGYVEATSSKAGFYLHTSGNRVAPGRRLRFHIAECTVPEPYDIRWKTLNRGPEAISRNMVRGQIMSGGRILPEPTNFPGSHYVECFIVKDGVCVARHRQSVTIMYAPDELYPQ